MEYFLIKESGYKILFSLNEYLLNIYIRGNIVKRRNKFRFTSINISFEDNFSKYISNFKDLIKKIQNKIIFIEIKENFSSTLQTDLDKKSNIKYIELDIINKDNNSNKQESIISRKIYSLNVEYYLTKGIYHQRLNSKPFLSFITKDYFNIQDILELIDKENILSNYIIDDFRYFNNEKGMFQIIKDENIQIGEKLILEFHIHEKIDIFSNNIKLAQKYYEKEIIRIQNKINKLTDFSQQYDLIYLYASPIILNGNFKESNSPISYMDEIRIILKLMKESKKKFNCKFECINENLLEDIIINNKTKILHISSHGHFEEKDKYSLVVENLKKFGQKQLINYNNLKFILEKGKLNVSKIDLVIVSTCYSEDFGKLFLEYGAKNVIYIDRKTELIDRISVIFTKYFYQNILENKSIEDSYNDAKKSMESDFEIKKINKESCCCNHYHKQKCLLKIKEERDILHKNFHSLILQKCKCNNEQSNYHNCNCEYYDIIKKSLSDNNDIIEENNKYKICCCDNSIEHNEILKIRYKPLDYNSYIKLFKFNGNGKLNINSTIKFNYNNEKFNFTLGRRNIMGKIFNKIMNNENYVILYGEKDLLKTDFAESLCVYLYERKIINNYEIFKINSDFDFEYMENIIRDNIKENKNIGLIKKNVKIIKFNIKNDKDKNLFDYLYKIYKEFCFMNNNGLYFIFIFDTKDNKIENIENNINKDMIKNENIFYLGINNDYSIKLLKLLIKGKNISITHDVLSELLINVANYKQRKIKSISKLLINGENVENIKTRENLELINIELNENNSSFPLYYLLLNLPLGLPNSFLELIFDNYKNINDDNNLIIKKISNNWNYINHDERLEGNFKEKKYMDKCYISIFRTLKLYTRLLIFFIKKNQDKIIYKNGNIHYLFNSYSNRFIWKSKIYNIIKTLIGDKIYNQEFNIENHKQNILNIILLIVNKIKSFRKLDEWSDIYLEEILLLFPSFFFLQKDNIKMLQICIDLCNILIKKTDDKELIEREEYLKEKLLLFLYSLDKSKNEIINIKNITNTDLKLEINFLKETRNKDKTIENFENLLLNVSNEMKLYIYREIAIIHLKNKNYNDCMKNLNIILKLESINNIYKNRIMLDYINTFIKKCEVENNQTENQLIEETKIDINENYKSINDKIIKLNEIIKRPYQKNLYEEAFRLRDKIYDDLLKPDIL